LSTGTKTAIAVRNLSERVQFGDGAYRAAETRTIFFELEGKQVKKEDLVALTGIEPVFQP
jgi:hypothetical protein